MSESAESPVRDSSEKPFLDHLEDLRSTLMHTAAWLVGGMVIAIPFAPRILSLIKHPLARAGLDPDEILGVIHVAGGFTVAMNVIFWSGLMIACPGIIASICRFIFPGLLPRERNAVRTSLGFAALLFVGGVLMGYTITLPVGIRMMIRVTEWMGEEVKFFLLSDYVSFVLKLLLAFGLAFELPVVLLAMGRLGIVGSNTLRTKRRHAIIGLATLSMFLTPHDPYTMIIMAVPLIVLYEACIWIIWFWEKKASDAYADEHDQDE